MPSIRFDKLIDHYLPTHEGTHFHPSATQELTSVLGDDGYLHIDQQVELEDYGVPYKQLAFISQSDDGSSNQKVYYLNLIGEQDSVADLEIRTDMAASNARALHVSAGHVLVFKTSYPYNPQTLKKMSVRLRAVTPGDIRIGLVGISDKAYIKPDTTSGFPTTSGSNDMYEIVIGASNVGDIDTTYKMFTGYFKGLSANPLTQSFPSPNPNTPYALLDDAGHTKTTTDVAMAIKCISGDYYIDSLELFDVENTIADIPEGASLLNAISDITDDNHITPVEKRWLKPQYDAIVAEYSGIYNQAVALAIDTAAYTAAYTALTTEITEGNYLALGNYFTDMTTTATFKDGLIGGVTYAVAFRNLWSDYWDEKSAIDVLIGASALEDIENIESGVITNNKYGIKPNYSSLNTANNGYVYISGIGVSGELNGEGGFVYHPTTGTLVSVPAGAVDCTASVFKSIGTDMDAWTYLVMSDGTVFPAYYSLADALFYNASNDEISTGVVIGKVKVGIVSSEDDSARILDTVAHTVAMELSAVAREQTQYAFKYLSQSTSPAEFEQYAQNLGITDFFTTLAVWNLFAEMIKVNQLQIGSGDTESGFVFYAIDNQETGEKIIQVWSDGIKIFEINPTTKNISIGDYENENGLRWVHEDRELIFKGTGNFNGELNHDALKTRPEDNSGTTVPIPAKSRYIGSDVYNAFSSVSTSGWTNVTGTFNATAIASATRLSTDSTLRQVWYATFGSDYSFTSPITARVKITFNCISTFLNATSTSVYVNGVLYSSLSCNGWGQSSTTSFFVNVTKGQTILVASSGQNRTQYVKMEVYGKGTILQKSSTDMEFINYYGYYGTQLNTSPPNAFDYSANLNYASGQQFLNNASTLTINKIYNTDIENSTLTIGTTPRTISGVLKLTSEMRIYFDNGDVYTIVGNTAEGATTGWYPISGSFKLLVATAAIQTKFVEPQANATYDLGYKDAVDPANDKRYANLYLSNNIEGDGSGTISGFDTIAGNVVMGSISVTGSLVPRTNPVTGSQSVARGAYYTPTRGLYNSSWEISNRGSNYMVPSETPPFTDYYVGNTGGDGPYSGTSATRVHYISGYYNSQTWYYAKF